MVDGVHFLGFEVVDLGDVLLEDFAEAGVVEAVEAVVGGGGEASALFVAATGSGVEGADIVGDRPLDGGVVASVEVETVDLLKAAPVAAIELIALGDAKRHAQGMAIVRSLPISPKKHHLLPVGGVELLKKVTGQVLAAPPAKLVAGVVHPEP